MTQHCPAIVGGHWYLLTRGHCCCCCCCCCCSGHDLCWTRLGFVTLCRMCSQLDRAAASWSWFPPALLGCLASCWMLGAAVCPLSIWWRIYLWSSCEAHLRWRWWRSSGCVRAVEGESGLELPSPDCRLQLRAGLGWAGLGWAGLAWACWAGEDVGSPSELLTPYNPLLLHHPILYGYMQGRYS